MRVCVALGSHDMAASVRDAGVRFGRTLWARVNGMGRWPGELTGLVAESYASHLATNISGETSVVKVTKCVAR